MDERLVVVMGATGSGKSSLIKLATGDPNAVVGHNLKSGMRSLVVAHHGYQLRLLTRLYQHREEVNYLALL